MSLRASAGYTEPTPLPVRVYDIVTAAGNEAGTAASTGGGFLAELLSLF